MIEQVAEFHKLFKVPIAAGPCIPSQAEINLRIKLIEEEFEEVMYAIQNNDLVAIADGICDLHYVLSGTSLSYGLPEDELFAEVHRSNMSKATVEGVVLKRRDGKIAKADTWSPPDIEGIIVKAIAKRFTKLNG